MDLKSGLIAGLLFLHLPIFADVQSHRYPSQQTIVASLKLDDIRIHDVAGYIFVSNLLFFGNMNQAHKKTSQALGLAQFKKLNWGNRFGKTTKDYFEQRDRLLMDGEINPVYKDPAGYILYSDLFYQKNGVGLMHLAFADAASVLSPAEFAKLNWGSCYIGSTVDYQLEEQRLFASNGQVRPEFLGTEGYINYSDTYYDKQMLKTFKNVSAALGKEKMKLFGWGHSYDGATPDFIYQRSVLFPNDQPNPNYIDPIGYANYTQFIYPSATNESMKKAFMNASAVLTANEFGLLNWGNAYHGNPDKFFKERKQIFLKYALRTKYRGQQGYVAYAEDYYDGNMAKAFLNISAVLSKEEFAMLNWGSVFNGTTSERQKIRDFLSPWRVTTESRFNLNETIAQYLNIFFGIHQPIPQPIMSKFSKQFRASMTSQEAVAFELKDDSKSESCRKILSPIRSTR